MFQGPSNNVIKPDGAEAIYAEPFGHISGTKVQGTASTPLDNGPGYQNLLGTKLESGEISKSFV